MKTILVFGDQLNRRIGALGEADAGDACVLLVESAALVSRRHRQRNHLVVASMRRFRDELLRVGFEVDHRTASTMRAGIEAHIAERSPEAVVATEPNSRRARDLCRSLDIDQTRSDQFLCHHEAFAEWAHERRQLRLEDFYRWNRGHLGYLMEGEEPVGGRWNLDAENREPPPADVSVFAAPMTSRLDDLDREVLDGLPGTFGAEPVGLWATSRRAALARLRHFVDNNLASFGTYEDAMTTRSWSLAHSLLSPYLNLGLLLPGEVCDLVEQAHLDGRVPLNAAEGFIRQVIGWREFVWGLYWLWPDHQDTNVLGHRRDMPPAFTGDATTEMACVQHALDGLHDRAWVHHIPRLMLLSNFANLYGIDPAHVLEWMSDRYIDAAEWVMVPNVMGMGMWADGGRMSTKPYVSAGAYINRMSDHCRDCRFTPSARVGDEACPFTTLYWDFLAEHRETLSTSSRMQRQLANLDRIGDLAEVRRLAPERREALRRGAL